MKEEREVQRTVSYRKGKEGPSELALELRSNDVVEQAMETSGAREHSRQREQQLKRS